MAHWDCLCHHSPALLSQFTVDITASSEVMILSSDTTVISYIKVPVLMSQTLGLMS